MWLVRRKADGLNPQIFYAAYLLQLYLKGDIFYIIIFDNDVERDFLMISKISFDVFRVYASDTAV